MDFLRAIALLPLLLLAGYGLGAAIGVAFGLVWTAARKVCRLWSEHELAPQRRGAREVDARSAPQLVALLDELAQRSSIKTPGLHVLDSPHANAIAAGRDRRHASICVTTGLLNALTREELTGVLSHEIAHVLRRSALHRTTAAVLAATAALLPFVAPFFRLGIGLSLLMLFVVPPAAVLVLLAINRGDEYAVDARGALLSGRPDVLAAALRIASTDDPEFDEMASSKVATALLAFGRRLAGPGRDNLFSAYPSPENRIAALERQSRGLGPDDRRSAGARHSPDAPS